ncbi:hypothetical protein H5410_001103, partial [Solanum commersonii]
NIPSDNVFKSQRRLYAQPPNSIKIHGRATKTSRLEQFACSSLGRESAPRCRSRMRKSIPVAPPVIVFSSACAGLAGGVVPVFAQLASSSYHTAVSSFTLPSTASQDENMGKSRTSSTL